MELAGWGGATGRQRQGGGNALSYQVIAKNFPSTTAGTSSDSTSAAPTQSPLAATTNTASTTMMPSNNRFTIGSNAGLVASLRATNDSAATYTPSTAGIHNSGADTQRIPSRKFRKRHTPNVGGPSDAN